MNRFVQILAWVGLIACMVIIFSLSAQTGEDSGSLTKTITHHVVRVIAPTQADEGFFDRIHHIVRKLGHASGYLLLALLSAAAFASFPISLRERMLLVFLFCFLHAFCDEWHQTFIAGRSGEFLDVAIDMTGASVGMLLSGLIIALKRRRVRAHS